MDDKEKNKLPKGKVAELKQQSAKIIKKEIEESYKIGIEYYEDVKEHED